MYIIFEKLDSIFKLNETQIKLTRQIKITKIYVYHNFKLIINIFIVYLNVFLNYYSKFECIINCFEFEL